MKDEIIMKDGKPHKIAQVVMLPTKEQRWKIGNEHDDRYEFYSFVDKKLYSRQSNAYNWSLFHLYILSSEEIKEGDWTEFEGEVKQAGKAMLEYLNSSGDEAFKKIIATTDEALTYKISVDCGSSIGNTLHTKNLPRPSDDFLKAFVKAQGKGFDKVLVEYIKLEEPTDDGNSKKYIQYDLKIAPDNIITIKPVEKGKKDYGIEYLKFIATRFAHECRLKGVVSNHETCTLFDKWIKENL